MQSERKISVATGEAAYPLIKNIVDIASKKWHNLYCEVFKIKNWECVWENHVGLLST